MNLNIIENISGEKYFIRKNPWRRRRCIKDPMSTLKPNWCVCILKTFIICIDMQCQAGYYGVDGKKACYAVNGKKKR